MSKKYSKKVFILLIFVISIFSKTTTAKNTDVIRVGYYNNNPFYFYDDNGDINGYYHDVMNSISKKLNLEIEYVEAANTAQHFENLDLVGEMTLGVIKDECSSEKIINSMVGDYPNLNVVYASGYDDLSKMIETNQVDLFLGMKGNKSLNKYMPIYNGSAGPTYIIANKENRNLLNEINKMLNDSTDSLFSDIKFIHQNYFSTFKQYLFEIGIVLSIIITLSLCIFVLVRSLQKRIYKYKTLKRMKKREFEVFYQPIVDLNKNIIIGFEALLRLRGKKNIIISPSIFIDDIAKNNMLKPITLWIIENIMRNYNSIVNKWIYDKFYISINVTIKEIEDSDFIEKVIELIRKYKMEAGCICLEITENMISEDVERLKKSISILKENGVLIAVDDFGIEYSNLNLLEEYEFDIIKIDKYFIDSIIESQTSKKILSFLSQIASMSRKKLIIEGVEEKAQIDAIKEIKEDDVFIQGYYYSKPVPIDKVKDIHLD